MEDTFITPILASVSLRLQEGKKGEFTIYFKGKRKVINNPNFSFHVNVNEGEDIMDQILEDIKGTKGITRITTNL